MDNERYKNSFDITYKNAPFYNCFRRSNTSCISLCQPAKKNDVGKHGLSLRLDGMEPGFNDKARERAIVMHSASYVNNDFIRNYGRLGRSFGCPAIAINKHVEIIRGIAKGSVIFIYFSDPNYESKTFLFMDPVPLHDLLSSDLLQDIADALGVTIVQRTEEILNALEELESEGEETRQGVDEALTTPNFMDQFLLIESDNVEVTLRLQKIEKDQD